MFFDLLVLVLPCFYRCYFFDRFFLLDGFFLECEADEVDNFNGGGFYGVDGDDCNVFFGIFGENPLDDARAWEGNGKEDFACDFKMEIIRIGDGLGVELLELQEHHVFKNGLEIGREGEGVGEGEVVEIELFGAVGRRGGICAMHGEEGEEMHRA